MPCPEIAADLRERAVIAELAGALAPAGMIDVAPAVLEHGNPIAGKARRKVGRQPARDDRERERHAKLGAKAEQALQRRRDLGSIVVPPP